MAGDLPLPKEQHSPKCNNTAIALRQKLTEVGKIIILITTGSEEEAHRIADQLLNQRKAACVNIMPRVDSLFW